jgi:secreted PhoX family phosphatase
MATQTVYFNNPATIQALEQNVSTLQQQTNSFPFSAVQMNLEDRIVVPENYTAKPVLVAYDRMFSDIPECTNQGLEEPVSFWKRHGEGCDGLRFIPLTGSSSEGLLVVNHENLGFGNIAYLYTGGMRVYNLTGTTSDTWKYVYRMWEDVYKHALTMGVSVNHIRREPDTLEWSIVLDSPYNKRYNLFTPFRVDGPLRNHPLLMTKFSPDATMCLGTYNNCASEVMPWGTFLTAEENCFYAFGVGRSQDVSTGRNQTELAALGRYNFASTGGYPSRSNWGYQNSLAGNEALIGYSGPAGTYDGYTSAAMLEFASTGYLESELYGTTLMPTGSFENLDYTCYGITGTDDFRNIVNCYNQMKEIDPKDPTSTPRVRTALGRYYHENSATIVEEGKPVVLYLNDDNRSEYVYKYVSDALWDETDRNGGLAAGDKYLNTGTLFIAKFYNAGLSDTTPYGTGSWISLKDDVPYPITLTYATGGAGTSTTNTPLTATINNYEEALVYTRIVGDWLQINQGASRVDRAEWSTVDPRNNIVYTAFTNNRDVRVTSSTKSNDRVGGYGRLNPPMSSWSPRVYTDFGNALGTSSSNNGNNNGCIIRMKCYSGASAEPSGKQFRYDFFSFGASPDTLNDKNINLSNLNPSNVYSKPDTCVFGEYSGQQGYLWYGCDDDIITNKTNPGKFVAYIPDDADIGDGKTTVVTNQPRDIDGYFTASGQVATYVGKDRPSSRFLTGVAGCEITGWTETPDGTTAFVGIQHPGGIIASYEGVLPQVAKGLDMSAMFDETAANGSLVNPGTSFPSVRNQRPRSTILSIQRQDGQPLL